MQVDAVDRAQQPAGAGFGQHRHRRAVLQQVGNAFGRVRRVDGHVAGAGLENTEQAHQHLRAASAADGDAVVGLHAQRQQVMSQLVGALIELLIGQ
ncbi:hypothetical protein [Pseudomonas sp. 25 E 4]|nr:hypothetical protein [Pseudomonas sp. 25 E 4]CRM22983.1 hypothetical protein [Pseudomonas sp. 25 E 4]CRM52352.1 hypothetical protein [Pseudomonas sp. 25 E 4]